MRISDWSSDVCSSDLVTPFPVVGVDIEAVEGVPVARRDLVAAERADRDPGLRDPAPLLGDVLALAAGKVAEEIVEAAVALVVPVELMAVAQQEFLLSEQRRQIGRAHA